MRLFTKTILLVTSIVPFGFGPGGYAQTNTQSVEAFLPKGTVTEAVYVQIERDPALDDYARRIREAREKNPEWFLEYSKKHQKPGFAAVPYHENFGVSRQEYEDFIQPKNHFREMKRKQIQVRRSSQTGHVQLDFIGEDLLLTQVVLKPEGRDSQDPNRCAAEGHLRGPGDRLAAAGPASGSAV